MNEQSPPAYLAALAGAGPAGLALALQAHDHGAVVRVIGQAADAGQLAAWLHLINPARW